jgi:hypothetical protein
MRNERYDIDLKSIREYMKMPAIEKLKYLYDNVRFFKKIMPEKNKIIWEELKKNGF